MLEMIDKGQASDEHPHPLLFVHGAWHSGWCWNEHFLDFFAGRGFRALALSLRGHGTSPIEKSLRRCSISDFLTDLSSVTQNLPTPPVLVGHSMGGFLVQKYLETHDIPAAVLIASAPPRGHLRSLLRSMRRHPYRSNKFALTGDPAHLYGSTAGARELLFGGKAPDPLVDAVTTRLQPESTRAILFDMVAANLVDTRKISTPMLVMGGQNDQIYAASDIRQTAKAYNTEPVFIPEMGHELMLEPGWAMVADTITSWLGKQRL
ncbi:alpha/beta hydrolase [Mycobacterium sp. 852002-51057_SCH5723018]|uniref:alpha/beta hydrolase n=1 Tax=Mycobacterium sp. 852002-51057_SCH5723018 TaxID=1834094 RepID=UPI00080213DB|nr:alpha/beta fold hydrolase [Mycobacterium sp. 852002-51057_SCH5723018]OBG28732.1 alpha/beta hydrolase [Mycobacterium sp. 852002-51057_SCH5723018]